MMNFWSYILAALISGIMNVIIIPLFGGPAGYHQAMGLGAIMGNNALVVLDLAFAAIGNFNLTVVGWGLAISAVFWAIELLVNVYLFIKKLIPFV